MIASIDRVPASRPGARFIRVQAMENLLNPLEITEDSFRFLRRQGAVYVDKSAFIHELVKSRGPFFLARPRRFGKSLLVDTIQQVFEGRRELFAGLEIETRASGFNWEPLPVIRINMNTVDPDPDQFQSGLISTLMPVADSYGVRISQSSIANAISDLIVNVSIRCQTPKNENIGDGRIGIGEQNVVLLIDEYDFPLLKHLRDPIGIEKIRSLLYNFYSSIKGCSNFLRFIFITGITKFKQLSLFSALNNIKDITFDKNFSTICGFTEKEITTFYGKYLDRALAGMIDEKLLPPESTKDDIMAEITEWYDGYSWDGITKVFNPFSIKNFLENQYFSDYWYDSGAPLFSNVIDSFDGEHFAIFGKHISIESPITIQDTSNINSEAFLLQAGYLTIDNIRKTKSSIQYLLKIPNNEIKDGINKELSAKFRKFIKKLSFMNQSSDPLTDFVSMNDTLLSSLWSCDVNESEKLLGSIFSGNPKEWYRNGGEGSYKLILLTLMRFGGAVFAGNMLEAMCEVYSDAGRADLLFDVSGKGYVVMELKYAAPADGRETTGHQATPTPPYPTDVSSELSDGGGAPADLDGLSRLLELGYVTDQVKRVLEGKIEEAFSQILSKNYAKPYLASGKPVLVAAVAVYGTSAVMVRFAKLVWKADEVRKTVLEEISPPAPLVPRPAQ
ncbi:MAG: AAA family ATPase [Deltaproteobacteria bacterium]|jgi:hypothetical protein|nr:AAA family ATPase [Deltaproteobacteria bacterium]